jgi:hypothetical protein
MILASILIPLLLLVVPLAAPAQVRGSVVDTAGAPVSGATVEVWAGLRRVGTARSDAGGLFALGDVSTGAATGLVVRRMGYRRLARALVPADSVVRLRLTAETVMLTGVTAIAATRGCPNREDPRARAAWEAARAKYPPLADTMVFHSLATFYRGDVAREEIDIVSEGVGSRGWSAAGTAVWPMWRRQIRAGGYAVRLAQPFGERYALWEYAPLEMVFAQHFADPLFGELHTLSVVASAGGETTIRFCPRPGSPRGRAEIEGTLTLSSGGALLSGAWQYRTPNPVEDAGGEVDFLPPEVTTRSLLLPERSLFWRRMAGGTRYHVMGERYEEWRLFPGSEAPPPPAEIFETVRLPSP